MLRTITAIVITAVLLLALAGCGTTLTENSVATVQDQVLSAPEIDSPNRTLSALTQLSLPVTLQQSGEPVADTTQTQPAILTREEALAVAFAHAGVTEDTVYDLETDLDWEKGVRIWEVDFDCAGTEYEYDIDAATGQILKSRIEPPKQTKPAEQPATTQTATTTQTTTTQTQEKLTRDEAKAIALKHAGVSTVYDLDIELDKEKGTVIYEVDFEAGGMDYEYDIDAYTGKILRSHKERDD